MNFNDLIKAINQFLFTPKSPLPMALVRICVGLIVLQDTVIHLLPDFKLYYGDNAIIPFASTLTKYWYNEPYFDLMLVLPPGEQWRFALFVVLVLAAFCMTIGLFSRASMIVTFLCLLSFDSHFELNQNDGDVYLRLTCMILSFSNAGDALSIDNLLRGLKHNWGLGGLPQTISAPWAQRWLQLQVAFVYWHAFVCKIAGYSWISGLACYNSSRYEDCMRFPVPIIFDNLFTIRCFTWGTLVIELLLWTLIWFKPFRYWVLLGGLALHLGIEFTMNLPMFEWVVLSTYFAFIEPEDFSKVMSRVRCFMHNHFGRPATLIFDGNCPSLVRAVGLLYQLDIFQFLDLVDCRNQNSLRKLEIIPIDQASNRIILSTTCGCLTGFAALRWIVVRMPLLTPLSLPLLAPGLSWLCERLHNFLSAKFYSSLANCSDSPSTGTPPALRVSST